VFAVDKIGNIQSLGYPGGSDTYYYGTTAWGTGGAHAVTSHNGATARYSYDAAGAPRPHGQRRPSNTGELSAQLGPPRPGFVPHSASAASVATSSRRCSSRVPISIEILVPAY
jgi:hypothetical protein